MHRSRVIPFVGAIALLGAIGTPLRAQAAPKIELAFGYECGDRFIVRNDGAQPVLVEYAAAGSRDRSELHLNGKQSAEIASAQDGNLELWVGGKLVASEPKGNRPCAASGKAQPNGNAQPTGNAQPSGNAQPTGNAQPSDTSVVRPPDQPQAPDSAQQADSTKSAPPVVVYAPPTDMFLYPPHPFGDFYPHYPHPSVGIFGAGGYAGGGIRRGVAGGKGSGRGRS